MSKIVRQETLTPDRIIKQNREERTLKVTNKIKENLAVFINDYIDNNSLAEDLCLMTPKERVDAVIKLANILVPKKSEQDVSGQVEIRQVVIRLDDETNIRPL